VEAASSSLAGIDPHCASPFPQSQGIAVLFLSHQNTPAPLHPKKRNGEFVQYAQYFQIQFYTVRVCRKNNLLHPSEVGYDKLIITYEMF
jgi:hypothetical protein